MASDELDDRVVRLDEHRTEPKPLDHFREAEKALAAARRELTRLKTTGSTTGSHRDSSTATSTGSRRSFMR